MQQPIQQPMQQAMQQQEQLAAQQLQQQMMLCPVRVVYETQILMQPGDQIQPNQTLFINPQNPPPWTQNRQMQNPVIYVQQMPNNIIPTVQQHIDQNQLYLQQYQNYQQMIPQQIINQDQRVQIPNIMPQNMIQNFQTNINPNIPNLPDRIPQYHAPGQNINPNMPLQAQPQLNIVKREPNVQIVQTTQPVQHSNQRVEIKPNMYMNVGTQMTQPPRPPPQVLTVNPIKNIPQVNANVQTMRPKVMSRPIQTHSVGSQISPQTFANATSQPMTRIRKVAPTTMNKVTNTNMGARGIGQSYRPIQPRPQQQQQFRSEAPFPNAINAQPQHRPMTVSSNPNVINVNSTLPSMPNLQMNMPSSPISYIKPEENVNTRKRKSESPDEMNKKMAAIQVNITTPLKPIVPPNRSIEVGIHTNSISIQRVDERATVNIIPNPPQTMNAETQVTELKQITKLVENVQQAIQIDKTNVKPAPEAKEVFNAENDKLIRNTVFTQARGRVLTDKESVIAVDNNTLKPDPSPEVKVPVDNIKVELADENINLKPPIQCSEEVKVEKRDMHDASISLNTANNKGMLPVDRKIKQEKDFVLTHVLDGIVIQESNVAFPIREPATRRFVQQMTLASEKKNISKETSSIKEESKPKTEIRDMPMLSTEESVTQPKEDQESNSIGNPFTSLKHVAVKSWTTEELSEYLMKQKWNETASLFMEHEIDGESLFLVSKSQLLTIGVKENHAEVICNFVKV